MKPERVSGLFKEGFKGGFKPSFKPNLKPFRVSGFNPPPRKGFGFGLNSPLETLRGHPPHGQRSETKSGRRSGDELLISGGSTDYRFLPKIHICRIQNPDTPRAGRIGRRMAGRLGGAGPAGWDADGLVRADPAIILEITNSYGGIWDL